MDDRTSFAIRAQLQEYLRGLPGERETEVSELEYSLDGHSGFTYYVTLARSRMGERFVLRLPPPGVRIAGPADVCRQGRIMQALNEAGAPTPTVPVICPEPVIDGRPFILMEFCRGQRVERALETMSPIQVAQAAVESLQRLQAVPRERTGIGDEEPMSAEGEVHRWKWLMDRAPEELTHDAPRLHDLLLAHLPPPQPPGIVHGDFHYGNLLFDQGRVSGILDWEIAEIGQQLMDLGGLWIMTLRRTIGEGPNPGGDVDIPLDTVLELYGTRRQDCRWYLAATCYKYGAILGYNLNLHRKGRRPDPMYENLTGPIAGMITAGVRLFE